MNAKSVPRPTPEDRATERLVAAVESAIAAIQERLASLAEDSQDAKWSLSDLTKLLQLRTQLNAERPRTIRACWVDDPRGIWKNHLQGSNRNHDDQPEPRNHLQQ